MPAKLKPYTKYRLLLHPSTEGLLTCAWALVVERTSGGVPDGRILRSGVTTLPAEKLSEEDVWGVVYELAESYGPPHLF